MRTLPAVSSALPSTMTRMLLLVLLLMLLPGGGATAQLSFSEQTAATGLTAVHSPVPGLFSSPMIAGGTAGDFDGDGWQDLFVVGGGAVPDLLFLNDGDGTFTDRAADWNVDVAQVGAGSTAGDYDNDGELDLFVASHGTASGLAPGQHRLYHNDGGSFSEVGDAAGVAMTSTSMEDGFGAAFGDMDLDGDLDLCVLGWFFTSGGNRLFENQGHGTFDDVTTTAIGGSLTAVRGFQPRFMDMDGDRYPELLLAADFGTSRYYRNLGGSFANVTTGSGTGLDSNGMGQAIGDLNGDLTLDWYVTSVHSEVIATSSGNMYYRNLGGNTYAEESVPAGVNDGGWGWGAVAVDIDHDGDLDLVENNGWFNAEWDGEQAYLFLNQGGPFTEQAAATGLDYVANGLGLLHFDSDNDGDQDLVFFENDGPLAYYENELSATDAHWLRVRLEDAGESGVAPDGYGARVLATAGGSTRLDALSGGGSYLAQSELVAHFGLGSATVVDELVVQWPDGTVTYLADVAADQTLVVTCCSGWKGLGGALAGAGEPPSLTGSGPVAAAGTSTLDLADGQPGGTAYLVLGLGALQAPFKQGLLVPTPDVILVLTLDGAGALSIPFTWPLLPPGIDTFWQAWLPDAAGPVGWTATNGVRARS